MRVATPAPVRLLARVAPVMKLGKKRPFFDKRQGCTRDNRTHTHADVHFAICINVNGCLGILETGSGRGRLQDRWLCRRWRNLPSCSKMNVHFFIQNPRPCITCDQLMGVAPCGCKCRALVGPKQVDTFASAPPSLLAFVGNCKVPEFGGPCCTKQGAPNRGPKAKFPAPWRQPTRENTLWTKPTLPWQGVSRILFEATNGVPD